MSLLFRSRGEERSGRRQAQPEFRHRRDLDDAVVEHEVKGVSTFAVLVIEEMEVVSGDGDALLVVRYRESPRTPEALGKVRSASVAVASGKDGMGASCFVAVRLATVAKCPVTLIP